jgi:acyl-CoA thioesterase-1
MDKIAFFHIRPVATRPLRGWTLLVITLVLLGCNSDQTGSDGGVTPAKSPPVYEGTIVAVGDSLTAGLGVEEDQTFPAQLARKLTADGYRFDVINAGVSGETSSGTLSRIQWVLSSLKPDIVILETGANDGLRGLDPDLLKNNLDELIARLKTEKIQVILTGMLMLPNLGPEYTQAFATIYPRLAEKHQVVFMPFFLEGVAGQSRLNQPDKLHPTAQGYSRIVDNLYPYVLKAIERYRTKGGL